MKSSKYMKIKLKLKRNTNFTKSHIKLTWRVDAWLRLRMTIIYVFHTRYMSMCKKNIKRTF